jgi:hypothetical protein
MSSTFSNLKFELIGNGEQSGTWGTTTNSNIGTAIEQAIVGMATLDSGDFAANICTLTLTNTNAAQDARALCLNIDAGAVSAAGTINVPAIQKPYIVINGSSYTVTVKVSGLTGVAVPAGTRTVVYNNGTDVGTQLNWLNSLTLGTALPVASGGTGSATLTANNVLLGNGTSALQVVAPGTLGNVLTSNGTTWASTALPASGTVTSVGVSGGTTGLTTSGGPVTSSGTITIAGTLAVANGGTGLTSLTAGYIPYGNGTSAFGNESNLSYDSTNNRLGVVGTGYSPNITLSDAATIAWDTTTGQVATFTFVSSNRTVGAPSSLVSGAFYALAVIQNAGNNTLTWNSVFKWANGTAPTLSTAAAAQDYFVFRSNGTNLYEQGRSQGVA